MKMLKNKSEITAKNLKNDNCDYKGHKLYYDVDEKLYCIGSWFHPTVTSYRRSVKEIREIFMFL